MIGQGKPLSILIVGDSAAAGVGVDHQEDALTGAILSQLQQDYQIRWKLQAKTGDATSNVIRVLEKIPAEHYDVVVTSVGVNDVTKLTPADVWIKKQQKLYQAIESRFSPELIIAAGVPPMNMFPALPNPLAWLFGRYAKAMNSELEKFVSKKANMQWIEYDIKQYQALNLKWPKTVFTRVKKFIRFGDRKLLQKSAKNFRIEFLYTNLVEFYVGY